MSRHIETYRDHEIVSQETRGHFGFAVDRPGGGNGVGDFLATGLPDVEAARAKIDKIVDKVGRGSRWP